MATNVYITEPVKAKLDRVAEIDKRSLNAEIDYLVERRLDEIDVPPVVTGPGGEFTQSWPKKEEESHVEPYER